jgi:O-antigen ligase
MGGLVFWRAQPSKKILLLGLVLITILAGFSLLPQYLVERYLTIFSNADLNTMSAADAAALKADIDSSFARRDMLLMSLQRTIEHPVFGVGPGVFEAANWDAELKLGRRVGWQPSHNMYTQVSAELGIPGLIVFLIFLGSGFASLRRVARATQANPELHALADAARCISMILITFCVGAFFLSVAYSPMIAAMMGLCASLEIVAKRELAARAQPAGPRPPMGMVPAV